MECDDRTTIHMDEGENLFVFRPSDLQFYVFSSNLDLLGKIQKKEFQLAEDVTIENVAIGAGKVQVAFRSKRTNQVGMAAYDLQLH